MLLPFGSVVAHHGHTSQFDPGTAVRISGVVTELGFVNPHAYVYLDVTDDKGVTTNWHCEMRAASVMKRSGWTKEMFKPGTPVDIVGIASRRESNGCYVETIAFNGGPPIKRYAQIEANKHEVQIDRALRTAWDDPYVGGDWAAEQVLVGPVSGPNAASGPPRRPSGPAVELTEAGKTRAAEIQAAERDRVEGRLDCEPREFFRDWTFDQHPNRIVQEQDKITLYFGFMDTVRTIYLNETEHPADIEPAFAGHSLGRWDGDVLVVDTIGFAPNSNRGGFHGKAYHTIERFQLDPQAGALTRSWVAEDSVHWIGQKVGQDTVYLSDYQFEPYGCDDRTVE